VALKPFFQLSAPRPVSGLPSDLAEFYALHEGVGQEGSWQDYPVRLCKLDEVERIDWNGLGLVSDVPEGWEMFSGFRIGAGEFFDKVVYVLRAPSCPEGSIFAIGTDMAGPGGDGPFKLESSLVLARSFSGWLRHLSRWNWIEPAIAGTEELSEQERQELRDYYFSHNPHLNPLPK
jgi:hypothetical protein